MVQAGNLQRLKKSLANEIVSRIKAVVGTNSVALHEPTFGGNESSYVQECINTGWVSTAGGYVDRFERDLAEYTGAKRAVATSSGTSALQLALQLVGVKPDDEVLVPALSFVATANAVVYNGAIPHFVDVDERTLGMAPEKLTEHLRSVLEPQHGHFRNRNTGRRIGAIVPMHTFGHPCEIDHLVELSKRYSIPLVEDAAESLGSFYKSRHAGTFGTAGILSFNGNKIVTTGGGGAILTNDPTFAAAAKHLSTTAKRPHRWAYDHDKVGFNFRLPNLNAALGCAQLEQLPTFLENKRVLAEHYSMQFADIPGLTFITEPSHCKSNYWLNALRLSPTERHHRDDVLDATNSAGLMTRPCWTPLNRLPMFQRCPTADLEVTEWLFDELVNLPSGASLGT